MLADVHAVEQQRDEVEAVERAVCQAASAVVPQGVRRLDVQVASWARVTRAQPHIAG